MEQASVDSRMETRMAYEQIKIQTRYEVMKGVSAIISC